MKKKKIKGNERSISTKQGMRGKLTFLQEEFCVQYVIDGNGQRAAERAGAAPGPSAGVRASRWLRQSKIQARIKELRLRQAQRVDVTIDEIVSELRKIAFQNIADYRAAAAEGSLAGVLEKLTRDQAAAIASVKEVTTSTGVSFRFGFHSKEKALELLGKYKGMFTDKVEVTDSPKDSISIADLQLPLEERKRLLQAVREAKAAKQKVQE